MTEPRPRTATTTDARRDVHLDRRRGGATGADADARRRLDGSAGSMPTRRTAARARPRSSSRSARRSTTWPSAPRPTVREVSARAAELAADRRRQGRARSPSGPATRPPRPAASSPRGRATWAAEVRALACRHERDAAARPAAADAPTAPTPAGRRRRPTHAGTRHDATDRRRPGLTGRRSVYSRP